MLRGVGFETADFSKPLVGIASTWSKVTPCNMHINELAELVEESIDGSDCKRSSFQYYYGIRWYINGDSRNEIFISLKRI